MRFFPLFLVDWPLKLFPLRGFWLCFCLSSGLFKTLSSLFFPSWNWDTDNSLHCVHLFLWLTNTHLVMIFFLLFIHLFPRICRRRGEQFVGVVGRDVSCPSKSWTLIAYLDDLSIDLAVCLWSVHCCFSHSAVYITANAVDVAPATELHCSSCYQWGILAF